MSTILRVRNTMLHHAVETLMWSEVTENGESLDSLYVVEHIARDTIKALEGDVTDFINRVLDEDDQAWRYVRDNPEQAGHDFILTRNRHGAGFWDRGLGDLGDRLTKYARDAGQFSLYVGDDGFLYN